MKFKVEIEVPDFPSKPLPVEASRISQLLGCVGCSAITYALDHHNDMGCIADPETLQVVGHYWVEDGMTKAEGIETAKPVIRDCKSNWENAIGDFFASKKKQKGNI